MNEQKDPTQSQSSGSTKWSEFLNSAFGLWLAGLLALTVAPNLYQYCGSIIDKQKQKEMSRQKNIEEFESLSTEISYRLSTVLMRLHAISIDDRLNALSSNEKNEAIEQAFYALSRNPDEIYSSLLPQYKNLNGIAIMSEILKLKDDPGEKIVLKDAMFNVSKLIVSSTLRSSTGNSAKQMAEELLNAVHGMQKYFIRLPYLDCDKERHLEKFPFC